MNSESAIAVSIILVNFNGIEVIEQCLDSIQTFLHSVPYEVIVVDNASTDGSADLVANKFPQVQLIRLSHNLGFGAGNNIGAKSAKGKFLLLLNTDTILTCDILPHLIEVMSNDSQVGIVGPQLLNPDGSLQISVAPAISIHGEYQALRQAWDYRKSDQHAAILQQFETMQQVDIVVGAAFFIRTALFQTLNGFDENFFMYFEESDLCRRAWNLGWKVIYTPYASLIHLKGHAAQKVSNLMTVEYRRSQIYFYQKHRPLWEQIVLRMYLLLKFVIIYLKSRNPFAKQVIYLALGFNRYSIKAKVLA